MHHLKHISISSCRVGAWRLLDLLKDLQLPISLLVNSEIYNHCPELPAAYCKQLTEAGLACEIVGHGCSNAEKQVVMTSTLCIQLCDTLSPHQAEKHSPLLCFTTKHVVNENVLYG